MGKSEENRTLYLQGLKRCSKCKEIKALERFSKKSSTWDGLRSICKDCDKLDHKRYRSIPENAEKERANHRIWLKDNLERSRLKRLMWDEKNKERKQRLRRAWHVAHKELENEKSREKMKQWVQENRERHRNNGRLRHARELGAEGSYTFEQWQHLLTFFNGRCPLCGRKRKLTLDHIVPLKWGGTNFINNIQALCKPCNSAKGDRHATDYRPSAAKAWADSEIAAASLPVKETTPGPGLQQLRFDLVL